MILDSPLQFLEESRLQSETMLPTRTERTCAVLARILNFNRLNRILLRTSIKLSKKISTIKPCYSNIKNTYFIK